MIVTWPERSCFTPGIFTITRTSQPAYLVVLPDDYRLLVRRGYDVARCESGLAADRIQDGRKPQAMMERLFPGPGTGEEVGTELDMLTVPQAQSLGRSLGGRQLVDLSAAVLQQRMVKDAGEIASIKKACAAIQAGHLATVSSCVPA